MSVTMTKKNAMDERAMLEKAQGWRQTLSKRRYFITNWTQKHTLYLKNFQSGTHLFSPRQSFRFTDELVELWCYLDRLFLHLMLTIIKPTFKHLISPTCTHLTGPSSIKKITQHIQTTLQTQVNPLGNLVVKRIFKGGSIKRRRKHRLMVRSIVD